MSSEKITHDMRYNRYEIYNKVFDQQYLKDNMLFFLLVKHENAISMSSLNKEKEIAFIIDYISRSYSIALWTWFQ